MSYYYYYYYYSYVRRATSSGLRAAWYELRATSYGEYAVPGKVVTTSTTETTPLSRDPWTRTCLLERRFCSVFAPHMDEPPRPPPPVESIQNAARPPLKVVSYHRYDHHWPDAVGL